MLVKIFLFLYIFGRLNLPLAEHWGGCSSLESHRVGAHGVLKMSMDVQVLCGLDVWNGIKQVTIIWPTMVFNYLSYSRDKTKKQSLPEVYWLIVWDSFKNSLTHTYLFYATRGNSFQKQLSNSLSDVLVLLKMFIVLLRYLRVLLVS